jgi:hypothetical protein
VIDAGLYSDLEFRLAKQDGAWVVEHLSEVVVDPSYIV